MQQIDMYKVYRQVYGRAWRIKWADHINANKGKALAMAREAAKGKALAIAREVAKRIKRKELLLAAEPQPPKLQVQPSEAKPQGDGEAQDKTVQRQAVDSIVPRDEARRVPRFTVTRRSKYGGN